LSKVDEFLQEVLEKKETPCNERSTNNTKKITKTNEEYLEFLDNKIE
jgi:hypothetical protein